MESKLTSFLHFLAYLYEITIICAFLYMKFTHKIEASYWWVLLPMTITWAYINPDKPIISFSSRREG